MHSLHQGFQGGEQEANAAEMISWLELADAAAPIRAIKRRMRALAPVQVGDRVLDVGCGIGLEVARLARRVGPTGLVVGIDSNTTLLAEARRRQRRADTSVEYRQMDAHQLAFLDGSFDLCRTERVMRYLERPAQALQEMARVVRPGGRVVAFDFDSDAAVVDASDPVLARRIREILDAAVPQSWIGRQLPRLFRQASLTEIMVSPHVVIFPSLAAYRRLVAGTLDAAVALGQIAATDVAAWWADLVRADRDHRFFAANLGFVVCGRVGSGAQAASGAADARAAAATKSS
jgi:ubiquinone/menaquinone biosynthesis C-methylase UbiE